MNGGQFQTQSMFHNIDNVNDWTTAKVCKKVFELFLDTITVMEDVWLVTSWQAIQWMRDPTPLSNINSFPPFQCSYNHRPPRCTSPKVMIFCNSTSTSWVILVNPNS